MIPARVILLALIHVSFLGGGLARAQPIGEAGGLEPTGTLQAPSQRERDYVSSVAKALKKRAANSSIVRLRFRDADLRPSATRRGDVERSPRVFQSHGVRTHVGETEITRLRFPSKQHAERYVLFAASNRAPRLVEVRGTQVVIASGPDLADPKKAAEIREAAWGGLPHVAGPPSVAATFITKDEFFFETRVPSRGKGDPIEEAFEAAKARYKSGDKTADVDGKEAWVRRPGLYAHVGEAYWSKERFIRSTTKKDRVQALRDYATAFKDASLALGPAQKAEGKVGARGATTEAKDHDQTQRQGAASVLGAHTHRGGEYTQGGAK
jgi:hypothetical protein